MNDRRLSVVRDAFNKFDNSGNGVVDLFDLKAV